MNSIYSTRWASPPLIRAPISSDDVSVTSSSATASDLDDEEPEIDYATEDPVRENPPPLVPVARLTGDETETEEEEEVFDEVDGDGFLVRVRMATDDDEADGGGKSPSLGVNFDGAVYSESSGEESFDEVDGDGFSTGSRVHFRVGSSSSTPRPSTSVALDEDDEGDNGKDEILGDGSIERRSLDEEEEEEGFNSVEGNVAGFVKDEVLVENSKAEKDEILRERSFLVEGEEFNVVEAEGARNAAGFEKDEILEGNSNAMKDNILAENLVLDESSNAGKERILTGILNLSGDLEKVGGVADVVDVKDEILGSVIEMEMDETEEESSPAGSNQDDELDEKYDTVDVAFEQSENKLDEGVLSRGFTEEEEKAVTKLEESSIGSASKPKHAENDHLFEVCYEPNGFEKESNETLVVEDAEIMDENGVEEEEMVLARAAWLLKLVQPLQTSSNIAVANEPDDAMTEEEKKSREMFDLIRVKFLRIVHKLGLSPEDGIADAVLNQLARIEDPKYWLFGYDNEPATMKAFMLEREENDKLDFCCNILVIGKAGVGKSATINSIFEEEKALTNAFVSETTSVSKIEGVVVNGIKIRVLDTPGLKPCIMDQASNRKVLASVKKFMKRFPPDVVLYIDRLDTQTRESNDLPLLKSITSTLGPSIWSSVAIVLTHAAAVPPEGPNGLPLTYQQYVNLRSRAVQQSIAQAAGDMRFMNRVVLVENHPSCTRNRDGQRVLPNGSRWVSELLLWCCSSKILSEAQSLRQVQDLSMELQPGLRSPPVQFFLSSVLESKPHPELSDSDEEDEEDGYYDQLPPFRSLTKSEIARLSKEHKSAYFKEYDYRVKLLEKKQLKGEMKRLKELKKKRVNADGENVQVPLPDMALPPSFDCDDPTYLYRFLEPDSRLHTGYILNANGWDHDHGYEGATLEKALALAARYPASVSIRLRKDKKDFGIHLDSSASAKHGDGGSSLASFDMQTMGNQVAYLLKGERMFRNLKKRNKTTAGLSLTALGDTIAMGQKLADEFSIGKRVNVKVSTGRVRVKGDVAYGANLEATLVKKDLAALGLCLARHHGALSCRGTLQAEVPVGRSSKMAVRVGMNNNENSGQITVRASCSEHCEMALLGLIPLAICIFRRIFYGESSYRGHNFQFY